MKRYPHLKLMSFVLAMTLGLLAVTPGPLAKMRAAVAVRQACATNPVVTNKLDSGAGSLRQAVAEACAGSAITFNVTGTIPLSGGQITIDKNLTIQGPGADVSTVQNTAARSATSRIFYVNSGVTATIAGLTITGGNIYAAHSGDSGGGVHNQGNLTVTGSIIRNNQVDIQNSAQSKPAGGGIVNASAATLTVTNSTISNNNVFGSGGGIANFGTVNLNNTTISANFANYNGGGIFTAGAVNITNSTISHNGTGLFGAGGGGIYQDRGTIMLTNSTVSGNSSASADGVGGGGGIYTFEGTLTLTNTTITNNAVRTSCEFSPCTEGKGGGIHKELGTVNSRNSIIAGNVRGDIWGILTSQGYNLIGIASFPITGDTTGNILNQNALLAPLADNGGPTQTHALQPNSPAIDAGDSSGSTTDQRGAFRAANQPPANASDGSDIGAFELGPDTTITARPTDPSNSSSPSFSFIGTDPFGIGIVSFECNLDGSGFTACPSPQTYNSLSDGSHTFMVRAVDNAGNRDGIPASFTWTIDTVPPDTTIDSFPSDPSTANAPFTFSGTDIGTGVAGFECDLDGGGFSACTSPLTYYGLTQGSHTFRVRAVDRSGNVDPTPPSFTWNVGLPCLTTSVVTNFLDSGTGSLRLAVADACAGGTVTFNVTGTIPLSSGPITMDKDLTIQGPGAHVLTVQNIAAQSAISRVFVVNVGVTATIAGLTVSGGNVPGNGGGIFIANRAALTVTNSTISNNRALNNGGGIHNHFGILTVTNSTISNNEAEGNSDRGGGGLYNDGGAMMLTNSTVSGNRTLVRLLLGSPPAHGGGIYTSGGTLTLTNTTITNNSVANGGFGGGIFGIVGTVNSRNSIIAGNLTGGDFFGTLTSQGYNLIGIASFPITGDTTGNILNQDPLLAPLANNSGPTQTHALQPNSPAIDAGDSSGSTTDQRGASRPVDDPLIPNAAGGDGSDIGAFEVQTASCSTITGTLGGGGTICATQSATVTVTVSGGVAPYTVTLTNGGGTQTGNGPTFTFTVTPGATTSYQVAAGSHDANNCPLTSGGTVTVNVSQTPTTATVGPNQTFVVLGTTAGLGGNTPVIGTGMWSIVSGGTGTFNPNAATPNATFTHTGGAGAVVLRWTISNAPCPPSAATLTLALNQSPVVNPASVTVQAGSIAATILLANVSDDQTTVTALTAQINGAASATVNGVTVSGLTINASSQLQGQVATACSATMPAVFTLNINDGAGATTNATLTVTVTPNQKPTLSYAASHSIVNGLTVNPATGPSDNGNVASLAVQSITPAFSGTVNVASPSGVVTIGNAAPAGSFTVVIRATDNCGVFTDAQFTLNVTCPTLAFTPTSFPAGEVGVAYSQTLNLTPAGTYSFSLIGGSLPSGLTLNVVTGAIGGTPTMTGSHSFTVKAQSNSGCSGTQQFTLVVNCPTITVNPTTLSNGITGSADNQALTASPVGGNYRYGLTSGALPAGVNLNATTGVLSGTPTVNGTFSFRITATGFGNCTGFRDYTLTISAAPCPTITMPGSLPNGKLNTLYIQSAAATPSGSYSYQVTGGSVPPGITFYGAIGLLYGYPTTNGSYTFTITATNNNNCMSSKSYTVTISNTGIASAVVSDYDGDGRSDFALWNEEAKDWSIVKSSDGEIQAAGWKVKYDPQDDALVSGDYDGDGKYDLAIFRRSTGEWLIKRSTDGAMVTEDWSEGTPAPADYDGDGKTDIAVWQSATGKWSIKRSSDGAEEIAYWGAGNTSDRDVPVTGDYDGDGKADLAVYHSLTHRWQIKLSSDGLVIDREWGAKGDQPLAADYDGDGKADLAVWRAADSKLRVLSHERELNYAIDFETRGDCPLLGDYNGDGEIDLAIRHSGERAWYIKFGGERGVERAVSDLEVRIPERRLRN